MWHSTEHAEIEDVDNCVAGTGDVQARVFLDSSKEALDLIQGIRFEYPGEELLQSFLQEAEDCDRAATFLIQKSYEDCGLERLLDDWKRLISTFADHESRLQLLNGKINITIAARDQNQCRITGLGPSFFDPLVVAPVFPWNAISIDKSLHEILKAFVGPSSYNWLINKAEPVDDSTTHWLVRKSAYLAQRRGFFKFKIAGAKAQELRYSVSTNIIGRAPSVVNHLPSRRVDKFSTRETALNLSGLEIVSRFAKPLRWLFVARETTHQSCSAKALTKYSVFSLRAHVLSDEIIAFVSRTWQLVPGSLRVQVYLALAFLGLRLYGETNSNFVLRLPFGMYLKSADKPYHQGLANEYGALKLIRRTTRVPVPYPLDLVSNTKATYLLSSKLPGAPLGTSIDTLSQQESNTLVSDLQICLKELRSISNTTSCEYAITNAIGGQLFDHRINAALEDHERIDDLVGPFIDEQEFNKRLQTAALPKVFHRSGHKVVFTHGDLNLRNILTSNGRLSGFVDWENCGWYPEYWDCTKALYATKHKRRWLRIVDEVFKALGDFEAERKTERQLWEFCY